MTASHVRCQISNQILYTFDTLSIDRCGPTTKFTEATH
jgi:hypothetical protein